MSSPIRFCFLLLIVMVSLTTWSACNLEKEIDLELPEYNGQKVIECYLEVGQPFTLLLTKSSAYFDAFPSLDDELIDGLLEQDATVNITHNGKTYELENQLGLNPFTGKIFNYINETPIPEDFTNSFELSITTQSGEVITGTTQLKPIVPLDSLVVEFSETQDTLARLLTYFTDDESEDNWYRRMLHFGTIDTLEQDFALDDQFVDNGTIVFGTGYDFTEGDTIISSLFHIEQAYFDYLISVATAVSSNGNPFGQPSTIISNVKGDGDPIGIFTGFSYDRQEVIISK